MRAAVFSPSKGHHTRAWDPPCSSGWQRVRVCHSRGFAPASAMYAQGMKSQPRVQAVVVLYKTTVQGSATMQSLRGIFAAQPGIAERFNVLIYDNSPTADPSKKTEEQAEVPGEAGSATEFRHDPTNGGLAKAYGYALEGAVQRGLDWLLLLDQDTTLTSEFLLALLEAIEADPPSLVCGIVPRQVRDGVPLSPRIVHRGRELPVADGVATERLIVFNSAACLRVTTLVSIGGFPQEFPLDYLDHVVFHRLQASGNRLLVLPVSIEHQLSVKNLAEEMSLERYQGLLAAEWGYIREVKPKGGPLVQRVRLLQRALVQSKMPDKRYARQTLAAAFAAQPRH